MDTTITPSISPVITKIATESAKVASNAAQVVVSGEISGGSVLGIVFLAILGICLGMFLLYLKDKWPDIQDAKYPLLPGTRILVWGAYSSINNREGIILRRNYSQEYKISFPCSCEKADIDKRVKELGYSSNYVYSECPLCRKDTIDDVDRKYLIPLNDKGQKIQKKGGVRMPRAIKWSLWVAIVILVYKFVGNAELIATTVAKHWLHL